MSPLAAIRITHDDSIDTTFAEIAKLLSSQGLRVAGVIQHRGEVNGECYCADMDLENLSDGQMFRISQPLGNGSRGCRLNPGGLAACAAVLENEVKNGCDLLILNRFGKGESEGRGFRDLIALALSLDVPVLTAYRESYADDWEKFGAGVSCNINRETNSILEWHASIHVPKSISASTDEQAVSFAN